MTNVQKYLAKVSFIRVYKPPHLETIKTEDLVLVAPSLRNAYFHNKIGEFDAAAIGKDNEAWETRFRQGIFLPNLKYAEKKLMEWFSVTSTYRKLKGNVTPSKTGTNDQYYSSSSSMFNSDARNDVARDEPTPMEGIDTNP